MKHETDDVRARQAAADQRTPTATARTGGNGVGGNGVMTASYVMDNGNGKEECFIVVP